jgi:hypothetical protein
MTIVEAAGRTIAQATTSPTNHYSCQEYNLEELKAASESTPLQRESTFGVSSSHLREIERFAQVYHDGYHHNQSDHALQRRGRDIIWESEHGGDKLGRSG